MNAVTPTHADSALSLRAVSKRFAGLTVLNDLNMDIRRGEIHGLIGPNGAGKTTAINIATGFYQPSSGAVLLDGVDVTRTPSHRRAARGLGRSFQGARLFDNLDVRTNIRISVEQRRRCLGEPLGKDAVLTEVAQLMHEARLTPYSETIVGRMPYGVRKQVEIVRAFGFASCALLLDEPTAGLSQDEIERVLAIIHAHRAHIAILIVEHDMEVIMSTCDRITVIDAGKWLMTDTPAEVQGNPDVIAAYLGEE